MWPYSICSAVQTYVHTVPTERTNVHIVLPHFFCKVLLNASAKGICVREKYIVHTLHIFCNPHFTRTSIAMQYNLDCTDIYDVFFYGVCVPTCSSNAAGSTAMGISMTRRSGRRFAR